MDNKPSYKESSLLWSMLLCLFGIVINLLGAATMRSLKLPLYLDSVGTVISAVIGGYLPGIAVGLATNMFKGLVNSSSVYYALINVLLGICAAFFQKKGLLKKPANVLLLILALAVIGGGHGSVLTWLINGAHYESFTPAISNGSRRVLTWLLYGADYDGFSTGLAAYFLQKGNFTEFQAQLIADFLIDIVDKAITVLIAIGIFRLLPEGLREKLKVEGWRQTPLSEEDMEAAKKTECRSVSIGTKILLLLIFASVAIAAVATSISVMLFRKSMEEEHIDLGKGIAELAASVIDTDKVDEYIERGEEAEGYRETEDLLYRIRDSYPDIQYVYVYKIMNDGCHVVFDLDTEELEGSNPGDIIEFDDAFSEYLPALLAGEKIDPIISDETYGWLLTVYQPVYDKHGYCCCYACADVSMNLLKASGYSFFARLLVIFMGFFILILAVGLWLAKYNIILPVNTIALSASRFVQNSDGAMEKSLENIRAMDIHTGDEIENLYKAYMKMSEDTIKHIGDIEAQTETISKMQNGLIMVLADMVESRDQNTGDHVRKTAAYTRIIMEHMKKLGYYTDVLTDEFMDNVENSAPLHDVGKIKVSDTILNKPGKLTDEEFEIMKLHTVYGNEVIEQAIDTVPDSGYLEEAKNLATYHHEKWDGSGYPKKLKGEEIPLSARIMAVADVFDALVSKRSYKEPFTFEKAMEIIKEGAGHHFDPKVAEAFIDASDEARVIAERFEMVGVKRK